MRPYRTDEFIQKLYYETSRFSAFNHQWVVKTLINNSQRDPTFSCEREMSYQVMEYFTGRQFFSVGFNICNFISYS